MSAYDRLRRLEGVVPPVREPYPYDVGRLTVDQKERCAQISERHALVGMDGLTDQEVEDAAAIAEILVAPVWPLSETSPAPAQQWRTQWQRTKPGG